jgi:hypothetical protein
MLWVHREKELEMDLTMTAKAMMTARELAELLLTYGDMPVAVQVIETHEGHEYNAVEGDEGVHCEINARPDGSRYLAVVGYSGDR